MVDFITFELYLLLTACVGDCRLRKIREHDSTVYVKVVLIYDFR